MKTSILGLVSATILALAGSFAQAETLPLFDAHIHYSREAWQHHSPQDIMKIFDEAGVTRALVSSTPDDGTLKLYEANPARIVPELRPYRSREDMSTWFNDPAVLQYLEERLQRGIYRGIGEFHLSAGQSSTPVIRRVVELAVAKNLVLHAHSDEGAVEELFAVNPRVKILWAHAGMSSSPETVGGLLDRYPNLWVELSIRSDIAPGGRLDPAWRAVFLRHPGRFMVGTDTWTTSRWPALVSIAQATRQWLAQLPFEVAERIAFRNAASLYGP